MKSLFPFILVILVFGCSDKKTVKPDVTGFEMVDVTTVQIKMDKEVNETSGLAKMDSTYWTHNDSGGEAVIYQISVPAGQVIRKVEIDGVKNHDWEELTYDSMYLYIGDFGNNLGGRKNLMIHRVSITDISNMDIVTPETISFSYPDQEKYYRGYNHNHDCESMITYGDSIYLFSKNWLDKRCKLFALPKEPGSYAARLISEFDSKGTVTAAVLSEDEQHLYLLGYNPGVGFDPFVWSITNWSGENFLSGAKERRNIKVRRQMEAIEVINNKDLLLSAEHEGTGYPALFRLNGDAFGEAH